MKAAQTTQEKLAAIRKAQQEKAGPCILAQLKAKMAQPTPAAQSQTGPARSAPPPSANILGKRPIIAPKDNTVPNPDEEVDQSIRARLLNSVFKIPIFGRLTENVVDSVDAVVKSYNGMDEEEIEAQRKARREKRRARSAVEEVDATVIVDSRAPSPVKGEEKELDQEEALKLLLQLQEDEEFVPPPKRARTSKHQKIIVGAVEYNTYIRLAKAMDSKDFQEQDVWLEKLEILFPEMARTTDKKKHDVLAAHKGNWGFPAYLMCLEIPLGSITANKPLVQAYNRWIKNHLKIDNPADWDGTFEPPGLAKYAEDDA